MAHRKTSALGRLLNLVLLVPSLFGFVTNIKNLISLEARLALRSLVIVIIAAVCVAGLLVSTWLCFLFMIFLYLQSLHVIIYISLLILMLLNIILMILIATVIAKHKENLLFPATRRQVRQTTSRIF
jgi:hypothetical protein